MSAYEPPTEIDPIFNSLAFQGPNNDSLTTAEADERYLARQNVATSVASATTFSAEVGATSFTSLNSGATNFHIDNLAGNDASLVIRNQRTNKDLFYRQFGTTNSHIFTTNNAATTNLTLSNTENLLGSTNVLTRVDVTGSGTAIQAFKVRDKTSTNQVVITPNATINFLNPMTGGADTQVLGGSIAAINTCNLVLTTWSSTTSGVRLTPTTVNIGAGGTTNITPTSGILFNSSAGNATVTGNLTMSDGQIGGVLQINSTNSGALGFLVQNLANNTGGLVVRNNNAASDLVIDCGGSARTLSLRIANVSQVSVTANATTFLKQTLSTPGAAISATGSLALPLNDLYFITAAGAITVTLPTNAAAYTGSRIIFRRTAAGGIITVDQTGGASALQAAGSTTTATSVSIAASTVTFEFVSNGTLWCQL